MGHDEHGPAYPAGPRETYPTEEELCKGRPWSTVIVTWAIMIATFVWIFWRH